MKPSSKHDPTSRAAGFSLTELLVVILILVVLAGISVSALNRMRTQSAVAGDMSNLRQMFSIAQLYGAERSTIHPDNLLFWDTTMESFIPRDSFYGMLKSKQWSKMNEKRDVPAYTLNGNLWSGLSPSDPQYADWKRAPAPLYQIFGGNSRPMYYHGVYFPPNKRAYSWGGLSHVAPVYSEKLKPNVSDNIQGKAVFLFNDGSTQMVNTTSTKLRW
jgi:prepilin-type N-terminal cleavage/methylation domain-containing protein